jgi:hypothetical protein
VRVACGVPGPSSGTVRLFYQGDADSQFAASVDGTTTTYFLRSGGILSNTQGSPMQTEDQFVKSNGSCPHRPYQSLGTWTTTIDPVIPQLLQRLRAFVDCSLDVSVPAGERCSAHPYDPRD